MRLRSGEGVLRRRLGSGASVWRGEVAVRRGRSAREVRVRRGRPAREVRVRREHLMMRGPPTDPAERSPPPGTRVLRHGPA